ncbi:MAG: DoxX family protein [Anaerolineae bacterium]
MHTEAKLTASNHETGALETVLNKTRSTTGDRALGIMRIFLGVLFAMTGLMKLFVPMLREAFSGQLTAANIPLHTFNMWFVPITEVTIGLLLVWGLFSRIGGLVAINIMIVATYVHLVVKDPALFPLQPTQPIIPLVAIVIAGYVLWRGGGGWSADLNAIPSK